MCTLRLYKLINNLRRDRPAFRRIRIDESGITDQIDQSRHAFAVFKYRFTGFSGENPRLAAGNGNAMTDVALRVCFPELSQMVRGSNPLYELLQLRLP
ncbi:MAG: hypothetical protein ACK2UO_14645 [Caldilineaceae bacterium]